MFRNYAFLSHIDHFKKINGTYGNDSGDTVLVHLVRTIQKNIQICDVFGRIGGEEFMLIAPDTGIGEASAMVDRLLETVRTSPIRLPGLNIRITCSTGIAGVQESDTVDTIRTRADAALYAAKREGRDHLKFAS